ncbi:MAG: hypothetical protein HY547_05975 [Elusimicrobia bacterium]|nr:hypothetical protein [Elusimicrobiota bacterium]
MKRIGLVEIGLFSSSLLLLGLIIWFFSLTFFGSRAESEAQIATWVMSSGAPAKSISHGSALGLSALGAGRVPAAPEPAQSNREEPNAIALEKAPEAEGQGSQEELRSEKESGAWGDTPDAPSRNAAVGLAEQAWPVPPRPGESSPRKSPAAAAGPGSAMAPVPAHAAQKMPLAPTAAASSGPEKDNAPPSGSAPDRGAASKQESSVSNANAAVSPSAKTLADAAGEAPAAVSSPAGSLPDKKSPAAPPVSLEAGYQPLTARDPMMTPEETRHLVQQKRDLEEQERRSREQELARQKANDPFELAKKKIKIQGVLHTDDGMSVIINNQILQMGDTYAGSKVIQISEHKVTFKFRGKLFSKPVANE